MNDLIASNLSELLDTSFEPETETEIIEASEILPPEPSNTTLEDDANYSRDNLKDLIKKGNDAISKLSKVAEESQHPRAYEVLATLIKNIGELNMSIMDIHKKKNDVLPGSSRNSINVDKAVVFTGSTTELIRIIKENRE
jgi:hypothetical protein